MRYLSGFKVAALCGVMNRSVVFPVIDLIGESCSNFIFGLIDPRCVEKLLSVYFRVSWPDASYVVAIAKLEF